MVVVGIRGWKVTEVPFVCLGCRFLHYAGKERGVGASREKAVASGANLT